MVSLVGGSLYYIKNNKETIFGLAKATLNNRVVLILSGLIKVVLILSGLNSGILLYFTL